MRLLNFVANQESLCGHKFEVSVRDNLQLSKLLRKDGGRTVTTKVMTAQRSFNKHNAKEWKL